jgi:phospholipid-binding lipoprotein MlaA
MQQGTQQGAPMSMPTSSAEAGRLHALRTILGTAHAAVRPRAPLALLLLCACMTTTVVAQPASVDPWQSFNRPVYLFNKAFDRFFIRPIAIVYRDYVPVPARTATRKFFDNLDGINVVVNDVLQLKFRQALGDSCRFLLNSTVGLGGLLDPASSLGLMKHYEDFGQTLGHWGVGDGGYLMLPVLGSSTLRDAVGTVPDLMLNPLRFVTDSKVRTSLVVLDMVDTRASYFAAESMIRGDEYVFVRNAYMQRREYLVLDGQVVDDFDDF